MRFLSSRGGEWPWTDDTTAASAFGCLSRRVRICRLGSASYYGRWLQGSGIIGLVQEIEPARGQTLSKACKELVESCGLRYETGNCNPSPDTLKNAGR
jgi:hypothetical protein